MLVLTGEAQMICGVCGMRYIGEVWFPPALKRETQTVASSNKWDRTSLHTYDQSIPKPLISWIWKTANNINYCMPGLKKAK